MAEIDVRVVDEHYGSGSLLDRVVAGLEPEGKTFFVPWWAS